MTDREEITQRWIKAAIVLGRDPSALVLCPKNLDGHLEVTDVVNGDVMSVFYAVPCAEQQARCV